MHDHPLDPHPITDREIAHVLGALVQAVELVGAVMDIASTEQLRAVFDACPWGDLESSRADFDSWMSVVLDGTTGLQVPRQRRRAG